jgi:hypothetical protein
MRRFDCDAHFDVSLSGVCYIVLGELLARLINIKAGLLKRSRTPGELSASHKQACAGPGG